MAIWDVTVIQKGSDEVDRVFVDAEQKRWAERIAVIMTADFYNLKSGGLSGEARKVPQDEIPTLADINKFKIYAAILKTDMAFEPEKPEKPEKPDELVAEPDMAFEPEKPEKPEKPDELVAEPMK